MSRPGTPLPRVTADAARIPGRIDPRREVTGVVLAGGRARRMGGRDKGLIELAGAPLVVHVLRALAPQVASVLVNANRHREAYAALGYPVVCDRNPGYVGPLAGIRAALEAAATPWVASVPCDCPFLPTDLVARLVAAAASQRAPLAVAHDGQREQPVFLLVHRSLATDLGAWLDAGERKIDRWYARLPHAIADFADRAAAFDNVNTPGELAAAAARLEAVTP